MSNDFERGSRYELLIALCHLPKLNTRDHPRRSWHIFSQLIRMEDGEKIKGATAAKVLEQVKGQLVEGFRILRRNRPLTDLQKQEVKAFVEAVALAEDSTALLSVIGEATAWLKELK